MNVIESALHILLHTLLSHMWGRLQLERPTSHHETPEVTGAISMASDDSIYTSGENNASRMGPGILVGTTPRLSPVSSAQRWRSNP